MFVLLDQLAAIRREIARLAPRPTAARSPCATSTPAPATAASTSSSAAANPYYDLQRYGLDIVASPRHADVLLVTGADHHPHGPRRCARAYEAMPEPRLVAALGDCALGCNLLGAPRRARRRARASSSPSTCASPAARPPRRDRRPHARRARARASRRPESSVKWLAPGAAQPMSEVPGRHATDALRFHSTHATPVRPSSAETRHMARGNCETRPSGASSLRGPKASGCTRSVSSP